MTEGLVKRTHFTCLEIEKLFELYREHSEDLDTMDRNTFREFLHDIFNMTDDILMDRIFKFFDTLNDGNITREEWIMGHNVFLKGTRYKLALLWGEAQKKIAYSYLKVT